MRTFLSTMAFGSIVEVIKGKGGIFGLKRVFFVLFWITNAFGSVSRLINEKGNISGSRRG